MYSTRVAQSQKLQKFENFDIFEKFSFWTRRNFFANSASIWPAFNKSKFKSRRVNWQGFQIDADSMAVSANQGGALGGRANRSPVKYSFENLPYIEHRAVKRRNMGILEQFEKQIDQNVKNHENQLKNWSYDSKSIE